MQKVVGIAFNKKGRVYNFNANNHDLNIGDTVIVETEKGLQYGFVNWTKGTDVISSNNSY